jgi:hypothetical protein
MKQEISITALPAGIVQGRSGGEAQLKLSAFISIQISNTQPITLASLADMLGWATKIKKAKWMLIKNDAAPIEVKAETTVIDEALWKKLFVPTIKVKAFEQEDISQKPMYTFNVQHILSYLNQGYEAVGKVSVEKLPTIDLFTGNNFFTDISDVKLVQPDVQTIGRDASKLANLNVTQFYEKRNTTRARFNAFNAKETVPAYSRAMNPKQDFLHFRTFHDPKDLRQRSSVAAIPKPDFEFHDILSVLTLYPQLLRKLGLVVDVYMPVSNSQFQLSGETGTVRLVPMGIDFTTQTVISAPPTMYEKTATGFYTQEKKGSDIDKGHLKIDTEDFTIFQVDTDGAALKMANMMDALQLKLAQNTLAVTKMNFAPVGLNQLNVSKPVLTGAHIIKDGRAQPLYADTDNVKQAEAMPGMRSAGIAIAKNNMANFILAKSAFMLSMPMWMQQKNMAVPAVLKSSNAVYLLPPGILYTDDLVQGYRMDIAYSTRPAEWFSLHRRMDEYAFKPASGNKEVITGIEEDEGFVQIAISQETTGQKASNVSEVVARWEGWSLSVPKPGNALEDNSTKVTGENIGADRERFLLPAYIDFRLEVTTNAVKGSLPKLRYGQEYNIKIRTVDLAGNSVPVNTTPENAAQAVIRNYRYLRYEPVSAPLLVPATVNKDGESAGRMVIRSNTGMSPVQYEASVAGKNLNNATYKPEAIRHVKPPRTSVQMAEWHSMLDEAFGKDRGAAAEKVYKLLITKDPVAAGNENAEQKVFETAQLPVEYLVDPMAAGVSFFLSSADQNNKQYLGDGVKLYSFFFDAVNTVGEANQPYPLETWMQPRCIRIMLTEGNGNFDWNSGSRLLTIGLPKGIIVKLNYSCFWRRDDIVNSAGMMRTLKLNGLSGDVGDKIATGRHWMFSPFKELVLVHATQQPVTAPKITELIPERDYGDNTAMLHTAFTTHSQSTEKVTIECNWTEPVDDMLRQRPDMAVPFSQQVSTIPIHYSYPMLRLGEKLSGRAASRMEYVAKYPLLHQVGDTKHRNITYKIIGTTRYRENFVSLLGNINPPPPLTKETVYEKTVNLLSTARPLAPEIEYVIPSFEWGQEMQGAKIVRGRLSNIRVYLKRPWYSSGDGELLGVVIPTTGGRSSRSTGSGVMQQLAGQSINGNLITQWGTDPTKIAAGLNAGNGIQVSPAQENFLNPYKVEDGLSMVEEPGRRVKVIGYPVQFDEQRQLYFADILFNINEAYFPFVKLAVARYQPDSLQTDNTDCCLSPIVSADFVQIPSPRSTSLEHGTAKNIFTAAILATGPGITSPDFATEVEITVEDAANFMKSDEAYIRLQNGSRPIYSFRQRIERPNFVKGNTFYYAHPVTLPPEYATKPYRIRIMEYEMIPGDPLRVSGQFGGQYTGLGTTPVQLQERLIFSDVYEVNG